MTSLATRLNPDSDVLDQAGDAIDLAPFARAGAATGLETASVALALRGPVALVRALIALDGQVARLLLVSGQARAEVVTQLVDAAGCTHLVTDRDDLASDPRAVTVDGIIGDQRADPPQPTQWLMTTSGTTGLPKIIPHNLASLSRTVVPISRRPVWGMLYDPTRFAGMQLLLQGLIGGGRLALVDTHQPIADQIDQMIACGVTHLSATPTLWRRILMVPRHRDLALAQITLGGEIADQSILTGLRNSYPKGRITHIYAATETGVGFAVNDGRAGFPEAFLDAAPGGVGVKVDADGLWLRPPTAAGTPPPAKTVVRDADGYLFTGDQVERRDGRIYFLGRDSGVINIGGVKVHPERVEAVIAAVSGVALAQVGSKTNPFTGALVVAHVQSDGTDDEETLRARILETCRAQLEREAVPAFIRFVSDMEINAAGKIVRDKGTKTK